MAMRLGCRSGQFRFARALQLASTIPPLTEDVLSDLHNLFISMSLEIPSWMFLQWLDLLLAGLFVNTSVEPYLVQDLIGRIATEHTHLVLSSFLVITSACVEDNWSQSMFTDGTVGYSLDHFSTIARPTIKKYGELVQTLLHIENSRYQLFHVLSSSSLFNRFLEELSFLEEPRAVLKEWFSTRAKPLLTKTAPGSDARRVVCEHYVALIKRSFRRPVLTRLSDDGRIVELANELPSNGSYRFAQEKRVLTACAQVFGPDGGRLCEVTVEDFEHAVKSVEEMLNKLPKVTNSRRLSDYSPWLAQFTTPEHSSGQELRMPVAAYAYDCSLQPSQSVLIYRVESSINVSVSLN
ncbi:hypothetical protein EG68_00718 [Paragonimus skrjabini miyazakii]|uniref:Uncharacterized protein n=1 Tax=Paragonimus skrjabini miyazakii TaxID=59628 RepID=A0A8S9Z3I2_9TREM|nr:hypothetical protein EG68_00718 [Paragonimus skrjabini miyazakii]